VDFVPRLLEKEVLDKMDKKMKVWDRLKSSMAKIDSTDDATDVTIPACCRNVPTE
jgi:hypothetical protein